MLLQTFTVVFLRLIAIYVAVCGTPLLANIVVALKTGGMDWFSLAGMGFCVVLALLVWVFSPALARVVCRKLPESVAPINATLVDLYSGVFVAVGICLVTSSAGPALAWMYCMYAGVVGHQPEMYVWCFTSVVKVVLGLLLLFKGRALAIGLAQKHVREGE